jgi:uncharacterized protein YjbJ (UPF0337 family)
MNWDEIKGNWTEMKGKAREKWGDLTDDDMDRIAGQKDQMVGVLQQKYGRTKEDAEQEADDWADSLRDSTGMADANKANADDSGSGRMAS